MAPYKLVFTAMVVSLFFLFTSPSLSASLSSSSSSHLNDDDGSFVHPEKVNVSVYYETLNPKSVDFIVGNLSAAFYNELISIINLRLVPWGNAYINQSSSEIICEYGPDECRLNSVTTCAIDNWTDVNTHYGLIYCMELLVLEGRHTEWQSCFHSLDLPLKHVLDCSNNGNGTKLALAYANETANLIPPLTLLPWVVVNNQPIKEDYMNYSAYVCNAYKGNIVPGCKSVSPPPIHPVF